MKIVSSRSALALLLPLLLAFIIPSAHAQDDYSERVSQYFEVHAPVVALTNVLLIDGTGAPSQPNQTIVIEGDRITAVGDAGEVEIPEGAEVLDLEGHTVLPGFFGLHNHTYYTTSARRIQLSTSAPILYLASGVTTIRTTGSYAPYSEIALKEAVLEGERVGPRMWVTGPYLTGGDGMTYMTRVVSPEDARRVVAYWAEEGVDWFKVYTLITRDQLAAVIDEAHEHGVKVTGHICSVSFTEAVELGINNIEHGFFTNTDYYENRPPDTCPSDFREKLLEVDMDGEAVQATFETMIENEVPMTSTLAVYEMFVPGRPPLEQRVLDAMSPGVQEEYLATRERIAESEESIWAELFERAQQYEYDFVQAGGLLAAGVDPTGYGGALPGYGDQRNYELLLEAGFAPVEVVEIMSLNGARVLGVDDKLGSVEEGKLADLIVIDGNPEANPEEIRNVTIVFKDGIGYDSEALIEAVEGIVGLR